MVSGDGWEGIVPSQVVLRGSEMPLDSRGS